MNSLPRLASLVACPVILLCGSTALAQTVSPSGATYPSRIVNGANLGATTRPQNLNPYGVSEADCTSDMTLQFAVTLQGFTGADNLQVWASTTSDCVEFTDRGIGSVTSKCWSVASPITDLVVSSSQQMTFNVRVQDLVGWQQTPPVVSQAAAPPPQGASACSAQPTPAAVPINISFLAVNPNDSTVDGTPYTYTLVADLVGPPAPAGVTLQATDQLLRWTPNTDTDTAGYDVFLTASAATDAQTACAAPAATNALGTNASAMTVAGRSVGSYTLAAAQSDTDYAAVLAAVDGTGNVGPVSTPSCEEVGTLPDSPNGVACAVAAPGEAGAAIPFVGVLGVAWAAAARSRRRAGRRALAPADRQR